MNGIRSFFDKLKMGLYRFMTGRNGLDQLNRALLIVSLAAYVIYLFSRARIFSIIYSVLFVLMLFRYLSRNIEARSRENMIWLNLGRYIKAVFTQGREYKIFICRECGRIIRIPRNHGKVEATCPQCGTRRVINTGRRK